MFQSYILYEQHIDRLLPIQCRTHQGVPLITGDALILCTHNQANKVMLGEPAERLEVKRLRLRDQLQLDGFGQLDRVLRPSCC
jgi:hypothetical protein